ncbi:hypothetical protein D6C13_23535 [Rahnella woolbedingensis]|uniref:Uncharacterized protein n=2 Tax=Rahnella woolbedingensis TaxID=1510574 RepID=A0A419N2Q9_9GAMM|nr:hypothetical protein D6C13_23535 [Rahnella woolbedingensis]
MLSMNPFYTSHRIGQLILKRSALGFGLLFLRLRFGTMVTAACRWRFLRQLSIKKRNQVERNGNSNSYCVQRFLLC